MEAPLLAPPQIPSTILQPVPLQLPTPPQLPQPPVLSSQSLQLSQPLQSIQTTQLTLQHQLHMLQPPPPQQQQQEYIQQDQQCQQDTSQQQQLQQQSIPPQQYALQDQHQQNHQQQEPNQQQLHQQSIITQQFAHQNQQLQESIHQQQSLTTQQNNQQLQEQQKEPTLQQQQQKSHKKQTEEPPSFMREWGRLLFRIKKEEIINFLQSSRLLASSKTCGQCSKEMHLEKHVHSPDGFRWRCNRACRSVMRLRQGTFFEPWLRVQICDLLYAIHLWANGSSGIQIHRLTSVPKLAVINVSKKLRACCSSALRRTPINVGPNRVLFIVQIDESKMQRKPKEGEIRSMPNPVWIVGLVDTQHQPVRGYMEIVPRRDCPTLTIMLNRMVQSNCMIHYTQWQAYINQPQTSPICIQHDAINHMFNFINPNSSPHSQIVDCYWNTFKTKLKEMRGCRRDSLQSYIDEFMWRNWIGLTAPFDNLINAIIHDYPQSTGPTEETDQTVNT